MEMSCPRCRSTLEPSSYEGVSLSSCRECAGQWLQGAELRQIVEVRERTFTEEERAHLAEREKVFDVADLKQEEKLSCPGGHGLMEKYRYGGDSPVVLDRCSLCEGTWLDGGELEQVQILAEAWEKEQAKDLIEHGSKLNSVRTDLSARFTPETGEIRSPLVDALMRGILRWW